MCVCVCACGHARTHRPVSDGSHQCSACVVKLSLPDTLTDVVKPSIRGAEEQEELVEESWERTMRRKKRRIRTMEEEGEEEE